MFTFCFDGRLNKNHEILYWTVYENRKVIGFINHLADIRKESVRHYTKPTSLINLKDMKNKQRVECIQKKRQSLQGKQVDQVT